jgi:hypothetical protein
VKTLTPAPPADSDARYVARLYLTKMPPSWLRARIAADECRPDTGHFTEIADAMDALLAEGFDPAAFADSLRSGAGAA